jgi:uncharacterized membrane protein YeaQ/YmgE (transglycosylase-associated protein family)
MYILGIIFVGFIVGLIARALKPGDDRMGILLTTGLGIVGAVLAGWLGRMVGWYGPGDGAGFIASTIGAMAVLYIYYAVTHRSGRIGHI